MAQLAPSSFNTQPYEIILVKSIEMKNMIAEYPILECNKKKVRNAPLIVVFLSFKDPTSLIQKLMKLEANNVKNIGYINALPSTIGFLQSKGWLSTKIRQSVTSLLSPLKAMPVIADSNSDTWSVKNTTFAAQNFLLAATSYGLSTCVMEGFDERRLCSLLNVPTNLFTIPYIICTGYPQEANKNVVIDKVRYAAEDMCHSERYGQNVTF